MLALKRITLRALVCASVYLWAFENIEGAHNIALALIWGLWILSIFMVFSPPSDKPWPSSSVVVRAVLLTCDAFVALTLIWIGAWFTATAWMAVMFMVSAMRASALSRGAQSR